MYETELDNKVILLCKAPSTRNLHTFWEEVQEYMDKGYRYKRSNHRREVPMGMGMTRVTLFKDELKELEINSKPEEVKVEEVKVEEVRVEETKTEETKVKKGKTKKTATKKPNTKKSTNKKG